MQFLIRKAGGVERTTTKQADTTEFTLGPLLRVNDFDLRCCGQADDILLSIMVYEEQLASDDDLDSLIRLVAAGWNGWEDGGTRAGLINIVMNIAKEHQMSSSGVMHVA